MIKTFIILILTFASSLSFAGPEPSKTLFGYPFKLNTDVFVWPKAINAELEVVTHSNITTSLGLKLGGFGAQLVANSRYYLNGAQSESPLLRGYVSLPLLTGGDIGYGALAGYQFVFDRKFFATGQLGIRNEFEVVAEITLGVSF